MINKSRVASILKTNCLDSSVTGLPTFDLSSLKLAGEQDFQLPTNVRLGHLAEKVVSELIKSSINYKVLYENIQLIEDKRTIGEIDFILKELESNKLIHMELAYKFYLFDPSISSEPIRNWIGPNRNDSLQEKLEKLKEKQFPLLYHECSKAKFTTIEVNEVSQVLCLLASLFVPYDFKAKLSSEYEKAIRGYYLDLETFTSLNDSTKTYYLPSKKEWGIDPSENDTWIDFEDIQNNISVCIEEKQAPLCWQKQGDTYSAFFIVWW